MSKLLGCDLEYAVQRKSDSIIVPAGVLPINGRKGSPEPLKIGGVEIDCCAVETTPPPAADEDAFVSNILGCLNEVKAKYTEHSFLVKPSHRFDPMVLGTTRYASEMGCQPDFNAWTGRQNPRPMLNGDPGFRSFGGHIHVEGGDTTTIKAMDLVLGTWSVMVDEDKERRKLYGKAGAYRVKPYGVEYRVLSNFWADNEKLIRKVFQLTRTAQQMTDTTIFAILERFGGPKIVQKAINNNETETCLAIYRMSMELMEAA